MSSGFVGSIVSLDCGESLGTYQGQVKNINNSAQTLTITKPYRNGLKCEVNNITLNAGDIKELKILQSPVEAAAILKKEATPSKLSPENSDGEACPSPVKVYSLPPGSSTGHSHNGYTVQRPASAKDRLYSETNGYVRNSHSSNGDRCSPRYMQVNGNHRHSPNVTNDYGGYNGTSANGGHRYTPTNENSHKNVKFTPTKDEVFVRPRRNSASDARMKKSTTPRKIEFRSKKSQSVTREDCFSCPADSMLAEFDFESNLALFDKKAVFEEIENANPNVIKTEPKKPVTYRHDENVLHSDPVVLQQIKIPQEQNAIKEFVTDTGLMVPSISYDLRKKLFSAAIEFGFKTERQVEMVGRSACEMVLQLLGGSHRLDPKNGHQLPTVVVLCGPHIQGAQAVSCARQLSNHNVKINLFVPNYGKMVTPMEDELALYSLCEGKRTSNVKDLPSGPVDIIINAMDTHDNVYLREQTWYRLLVEWARNIRAPVLALDPPVDSGEGTLGFKWCLSLSLPLALQEHCGQVYLCDLGFPKKVFSAVGIKYISPFSHKFIIPLHVRS